MHQTRPHPRFITIKPHTMTQNVRHRVTSPSKVHDTTTSTHPPTQKCRPGTPQCTPQQTTNKNKKVHWHTIEFSHNTRTPKHTPLPGACSKRLARPYTHPHNKQNRLPCESKVRIYQRSFSYRHLTRTTARRGVVGHADSYKATHTQPTTQISRLIWLSTPFLWQG